MMQYQTNNMNRSMLTKSMKILIVFALVIWTIVGIELLVAQAIYPYEEVADNSTMVLDESDVFIDPRFF